MFVTVTRTSTNHFRLTVVTTPTNTMTFDVTGLRALMKEWDHYQANGYSVAWAQE